MQLIFNSSLFIFFFFFFLFLCLLQRLALCKHVIHNIKQSSWKQQYIMVMYIHGCLKTLTHLYSLSLPNGGKKNQKQKNPKTKNRQEEHANKCMCL